MIWISIGCTRDTTSHSRLRAITYERHVALTRAYAVHAADGLAGGALSIVHFVWGPKPWTAAMGAKGTLRRRRSHQPMTIQADTRFVNDYRNFAARQ